MKQNARLSQFTVMLTVLLAACSTTITTNTDSCKGTEQATTRVLLQQLTATSVTIKWRGAADTVCVGDQQERLNLKADAVDEGHHKLVTFADLKPNTRYHYSIGGAARAPDGYSFVTAPNRGELPADGNIHIWLVGDSGTASELDKNGAQKYPGAAESVKQGFFKYNREQADAEAIDLFLLLGDNAYPVGSDQQWQTSFFDMYPNIIQSTPTLPTIGNHEMGVGMFDICLFQPLPACDKGPVEHVIGGGSFSHDPNSYDSDGDGADDGGLPYLQIFTLPSKGEQGGVPSGTEQYYSVDYGNVHIVSLDSQLSNQDTEQRQAMRAWLVQDLIANTVDWTVVIFHHPPYSKGKNHDSDLEQAEIDMREAFAPVFEAYGVDVVYSGHSHAYERSWYLGGHYGKASTFNAKQHTELDANGEPSLGLANSPYSQISATSGADDKAVYTVAGSSGKIGGTPPPCGKVPKPFCAYEDLLSHPAHRSFAKLADDYWPNGIERLGSVVLDISKDQLRSRFIDHNGEVLDHFIITK
ncbi:MAG: purple acid phosphatase family protein [Pseudomonadales bacterium]